MLGIRSRDKQLVIMAAAESNDSNKNNNPLFSICSASVLSGAVSIVFTVPQVVALSAASAAPLPATPYLSGSMKGIFAKSIGMQTGLKVAHFGAVKILKDTFDAAPGGGFGAYNINVAYGLVAVPAQAASYNSLTADVFQYFGKSKPTATTSWAQASSDFFAKKIRPGFFWTFVRDSNSVGGGLLMGPVAAKFIAEQRSSCPDATPSRADKLIGGTLAGAVCGFATQIFHNAALTTGRAAELGAPLSTMQCMTQLWTANGFASFYKGFPNRVVVIASMSGILNLTEPFK